MAGYTRQSLADIQDGEDIVAAPLNAEFDQLQDAFNAITGHTHDGTIGNGPKININDSTTGTLNDDRLPSSMTGKTFTSDVTIAGPGATNLIINGAGVNTIELGRVDGTPSNSGIDFHSSGNNIDYDSRIVANGGTGVAGNGSLNYVAAAHTFTGSTYMNTLGKSVDTSLLLLTGGITGGANIELYGPSHATTPNQMMLDANTISMRNANGSGTPTVTIGGFNVWHAGNMGPGSGLNADLLDGNSSLFYQDASNINAGTLNEARLPGTINGSKIWTGLQIISAGTATTNTDYLQLRPSNFGVGNPLMYFKKNGTANTWDIGLWDTAGNAGAFLFYATSFNFTGAMNVSGNIVSTGGNITASGNVTGNTGVYSLNGDMVIRGSGNKHLWFQSPAGVVRGLVYHDLNGTMNINVYNSSGTYLWNHQWGENGISWWGGHAWRIGGSASSSEYQIYTNSGAHSYRMLGDSGGGLYIQRSNDRFVANAPYLLYWNFNNDATFAQDVYARRFWSSANGDGMGFRVGDDAWIGDVNRANTMSVRGVADFNSGYIQFGAGTHRFGTPSGALDRLYFADNWFLQSDGNQYIPYRGLMLHQMFDEKANVYYGSDVNELNFPLGHHILCTGGTTNRNQTATPYNRAAANQYTTSAVGSALSGTWRARGQDSDTWMILQRVG